MRPATTIAAHRPRPPTTLCGVFPASALVPGQNSGDRVIARCEQTFMGAGWKIIISKDGGRIFFNSLSATRAWNSSWVRTERFFRRVWRPALDVLSPVSRCSLVLFFLSVPMFRSFIFRRCSCVVDGFRFLLCEESLVLFLLELVLLTLWNCMNNRL